MAKKQKVEFTENQLVNLYGLLYKVAYVDGELDKDELRKIFELINTDGLSEQGNLVIQNYLIEEPNIEEIVQNIKTDIEEIRYIDYLNSIDISICNNEINPIQQELLERIKNEFGITNEQDEQMHKFAQKAKEVADRGIDDKYAADVLKSGIAGLSAVGVPLVAVYFSGSVIGLSAAGITSGLAAIGLGLGMIPGIGIAIFIGLVILTVLLKIFDVGGKKQKQKDQDAKEERVKRFNRNLLDAINYLNEKCSEIENSIRDADAQKESIHKNQEVIRKLCMIDSKQP